MNEQLLLTIDMDNVLFAFQHALNVCIADENYELCTPLQKLVNEYENDK